MNRTALKSVLLVFILNLTVQLGLSSEPGEKDSSQTTVTTTDMTSQLAERMAEAKEVLWTHFYEPKTSQFLTGAPSSLPSLEQVKRLDPNSAGFGTVMEDVPLFSGTLLAAVCDQYEVTREDSLKEDAMSVFKGLKVCATAHGIPGFVARGVCPEDGKSIYITSSRDQFTHLVHGIWRYYHSPLCDESTKPVIREILQAIADRMTRNVTPENNYDFLRADGTRDPYGICRMLNVYPHEAARLAMFYAAAWDTGRSDEHYRLYRKHLPRAIRESFELSNLSDKTVVEARSLMAPYAVLQMQCSLELLHRVEKDLKIKSQLEKAMLMVAEFTATRNHGNPRHCGELGISQLMSEDFTFTQQHKDRLANAIMRAEYETDPAAAYCLLGAYWKARKCGFFKSEEAKQQTAILESANGAAR